jgi:hypothetical protein
MAEGGELHGLKSGVNPNHMMAPQSHAYIMTNLREARGRPLGIKPHPNPEERSIKKRGTGS